MNSDLVIELELIKDAMHDYDIPLKHLKDFQLCLADDAWDWLVENAKFYSEKLAMRGDSDE